MLIKIPYIIKNLFLVFILIPGCAINDKPDIQSKASVLQAYPHTFTPGENIFLKFPENHPENIAIRTPSNIWFSIYSVEDNVFIVPAEKYAMATELILNTATLEGITWIDGIKVKKAVFSQQGKYLIYMADNLETEPDNTFYFMTEVMLVK